MIKSLKWKKKIETHNAHRVDKVTEAKWGLNDETHSTHTKKAHKATHNSTLTVMNVRALSLPIFENNYAKLTRSKIYYTTNNPSFVLNSYSLAIFLSVFLYGSLSHRSSVYLRARYEHDNGTFTQNRFAVFIIQIASIWWNAWITHLLYETKSRQKRTHHDHPLCYYFAVVRLSRHFFEMTFYAVSGWCIHLITMHVCLCECASECVWTKHDRVAILVDNLKLFVSLSIYGKMSICMEKESEWAFQQRWTHKFDENLLYSH